MFWLTKLEVLLGLLPGLAWMAFFLQEDPDGEPKKVIFKTFIFGALFAFVALVFQILANQIFGKIGVPANSLVAIAFLAMLEEAVKFTGVFAAIHKNPAFDVPVDAMVYMVVGALGFATVENIGAVYSGTISQQLAAGAFETATFRFVGATLLHASVSAVVGYYWGRSLTMPKNKNWMILVGIITATVLHATFNYLILTGGYLMLAIAFVVVESLFVLKDFDRMNQKLVNVQG